MDIVVYLCVGLVLVMVGRRREVVGVGRRALKRERGSGCIRGTSYTTEVV